MTKYSILRTHPVAAAADTLLYYAAELYLSLHRRAIASALARPQPDPIAVDISTEQSSRMVTDAYTQLASLRASEAMLEGLPLTGDTKDKLTKIDELLRETCVCVTRLQYILRAESIVQGTDLGSSKPMSFDFRATVPAIEAVLALNEALREDFELAMALETAQRRGVDLEEAKRQLRARWE